jgi:hypothetical protein
MTSVLHKLWDRNVLYRAARSPAVAFAFWIDENIKTWAPDAQACSLGKWKRWKQGNFKTRQIGHIFSTFISPTLCHKINALAFQFRHMYSEFAPNLANLQAGLSEVKLHMVIG